MDMTDTLTSSPWKPIKASTVLPDLGSNAELLDDLLTQSPIKTGRMAGSMLMPSSLSKDTTNVTSSPARGSAGTSHFEPYEMRTPTRPAKRHKAPHSPAAAMLLQAACEIETGSPSKSTSMGYDPYLHDSNDLFTGGILAPPSPAVTPSRLLFSSANANERRASPARRSTTASSNLATVSPGWTGLLSHLDASTNGESDPASPDVGSIWKQPAGSNGRRNGPKATARRPLLALMTANPGSSKGGSDSSDDPIPLSRTESIISKSDGKSNGAVSPELTSQTKKKKDRKQYSTAGRPRVRGVYKCGKCGFMPKKTKHDCDLELAKLDKRQSLAATLPRQYQQQQQHGLGQKSGTTAVAV